MKKLLIATAALSLMCGSAFAQTSTGPAGQQDNMTKPGMTNGSMEKGSMNNGASGGTSNGTAGAAGGDMSTKGGEPDANKKGAMTGGAAGTAGTSGSMSK